MEKVVDTLATMDKLRKLTLGSAFTWEEFCKFTDTKDAEADMLREAMFLDCYLEPAKSGLKVVHGKDRKKLIAKKIEICKEKINGWHQLYKHLKTL